MSKDSVKGQYNEAVDVEIEISGENIICAKTQNKQIFKVPLKQVTLSLSKIIASKKEVAQPIDDEEVKQVLRNCFGSILVHVNFDIKLTEPYEYGEDADGNRGETRQDYDEVDEDSLYFRKVQLYLFDEDGNNLDPHDDYILDLEPFLGDNEDFKEFIIDHVNQSPDEYDVE